MPRSDSQPEWRLGIEPDQAHREELVALGPPLDLSRERLERPLQVVTVEHLAWFLIALFALLSRLVTAGARPLTAGEARNALFAYDLANRTSQAAAIGFRPVWSGWVRLVQAGIFAVFGAGDFTARLPFLLSGLLLVAMAFALRHYVGRAGAIAIAVMLAISPSVTWFSRMGTDSICAVSLALVTIALFMALMANPTRRRAGALGISAGLMIGAAPTGVVTAAIFVVILAVLGLFEALTTRNAYLRARVWLERFSGLAVTVILTAITVGVVSQLVVGLSPGGIAETLGYLAAARWTNLDLGFRAVVLPLGFYDFLIVIAGLAGLIVVGSACVRTRFARFCLLWTLASFAFYLAAPSRTPDYLVMLLVPTAMLGGFAAEYLHHTWAWTKLRYLLLGLVLFTLHAQSLTNLDDYAPDASEAPWARRANLLWSEGATMPEAVARCSALLRDIAPADATVFHEGDWPPALRWYLRGLRSVIFSEAAAVVVDTSPPRRPEEDAARTNRVDYEESWTADPRGLTAHRALLYFFTQRAWGAIVTRSAIIEAGPRGGVGAPTLILPLGGR